MRREGDVLAARAWLLCKLEAFPRWGQSGLRDRSADHGAPPLLLLGCCPCSRRSPHPVVVRRGRGRLLSVHAHLEPFRVLWERDYHLRNQHPRPWAARSVARTRQLLPGCHVRVRTHRHQLRQCWVPERPENAASRRGCLLLPPRVWRQIPLEEWHVSGELRPDLIHLRVVRGPWAAAPFEGDLVQQPWLPAPTEFPSLRAGSHHCRSGGVVRRPGQLLRKPHDVPDRAGLRVPRHVRPFHPSGRYHHFQSGEGA
mmetsp:Transcript_19386/g.45027  ORF Transcript_19386/g.45027 Transcript_19386/m.45027 type:complete len:255 (-) Transcript_19386:37-801(-)